MAIKKSLKKTLAGAAIAAGLLTIAGCGPRDFVEGKVIEEYGNISKIVDSKNPFLNPEDLDLKNPVYGLKVETDQGLYIIEVDVTDKSGSTGGHTAYNLAAAIEKGTKIKFATVYNDQKRFKSDRIGLVDPDDIIIILEDSPKRSTY